MESLEHNCGNISLTICTNMLISSKDRFLVLISRMIATNPIISKEMYDFRTLELSVTHTLLRKLLYFKTAIYR